MGFFSLYCMVVNPNDTTHSIRVIPRYSPVGALTVSIFGKFDEITSNVTNTYTYLNGYLTIGFDYTFVERDNYRLTIVNNSAIIYRGYIFATSQNPQTFKLSENVYV
jgi:hypothetical protein